MSENRITRLFGIRYPLVQGGMVWVSGWKLAVAVSEAGGLGLIGAGSMYPHVLREHIRKAKAATDKPFGVNIPLLYPDIEEIMQIISEEEVPIVFTSAGNPRTWTPYLKDHGITVAHVVSSVKFARKAADAGVDAIVAEGFEAGGHNGREETTTMVLIPAVRQAVDLPLLAAGGIATGRQMLAAMVLGADGVQMGSRFVASEESSAHENFKKAVLSVGEGDTVLTLKEIVPTRIIKNKFYEELQKIYRTKPDPEALKKLLGRGRAKRGMFEGDLEEGELEIGQVAMLFDDILPAGEIVRRVIDEFCQALQFWQHDPPADFC
ncbi:MAG: nitronate monooxygenase [Chlorobi bacterium]|nr:nitronate monooxygenase [Chlorobiota bacterium]